MGGRLPGGIERNIMPRGDCLAVILEENAVFQRLLGSAEAAGREKEQGSCQTPLQLRAKSKGEGWSSRYTHLFTALVAMFLTGNRVLTIKPALRSQPNSVHSKHYIPESCDRSGKAGARSSNRRVESRARTRWTSEKARAGLGKQRGEPNERRHWAKGSGEADFDFERIVQKE
eukprot:903500-Rhodomonas_salina.1